MPGNAPRPAIYKDLSYSQLRSYCETARLGSMSAAAQTLQVSHPTVWKQIRALEQLLGQTLVESDGRRSEITEAGRLLAELASPMIAEFESLQLRFKEACGAAPRHLSVAAPPRSYTDDLLGVIGEFRAAQPSVRLTMREVFESLGNEMLEAGEVDLVIGDSMCCRRPDELVVEKMYEIEPMVIMPVGHPLAKVRRITPKDLAKYPVLNHRDSYPDDEGRAILANAGVFDHPDRGFDLVLASSIRSCVKQGHGIGLVGRVVADSPRDPELVERSLQHVLPPTVCFGYSIRRVSENPMQRAFIDLVKSRLQVASRH
ncbi:LysR family transcriptional regulator [Planctomicrobium piriforme]|uniref:ModE molybdate transport repressor domain-containing protein n=1 Tax=Planctomicrobium piriforme TaxID=1576369 RepID=A0A1I3IN67_9PLAN|nr:LysR family transcriptional regulator [Planctomicrobium piriforme]SFI49277.1 ModE molybdate transport repressor domain-containing protein [Planctomicrobium piriforme]